MGEVVLLGREPPLALEVAAEGRFGSHVGGAERAVVQRCPAELDAGPAEGDRGLGPAERGAEDRVQWAAAGLRRPRRPRPGADRPEGPHSTLLGIGAQRAQDQPDAADAVDQRVVHLHVHREAVALEALDQVDLPERPVQVELVAVQSRDEDPELALAAGMGQGGVADVVVEIDVLDLAHHRQPRADQRPAVDDPQVPGWGDRPLLAHSRQRHREEVGAGVGRLRELEQPADVHRGVAGLQQQPGRVEG